MKENQLRRPVVFILTGLPGSGKTYLSRHLSRYLNINKIQAEQIRSTILDQPNLSRPEERLVRKIAFFLIEEFLKLKMSVVCDVPAQTAKQRAELRKLAQRYKALPVTIYQQVDKETAWLRCQSRHSQQIDDKYALNLDQETFKTLCLQMEPPTASNQEKMIVVSGLHPYNSQIQTILRHLLEMQLIDNRSSHLKQIVKPGLVNLIASQNKRRRRDDLSISLNKFLSEKN